MQAPPAQLNHEPRPGAARESLLIVAHGDRGGERDNRLAADIADSVRLTARFRDVGTAFASDAEGFATALAQLRGDAVRVYPLFMSDGYYVRKAIPERLGLDEAGGADGRHFTIMTPIGLSPRLPAIVAGEAEAAALAAGMASEAAWLLLAAHGSGNDPASREAGLGVAAVIRALGRFAGVANAFLEEAPTLDAQLRSLPGPLLLAGLFVGAGMHGAEDMQAAVRKAGRDDIAAAPPLARSRALVEAVCAEITAAGSN